MSGTEDFGHTSSLALPDQSELDELSRLNAELSQIGKARPKRGKKNEPMWNTERGKGLDEWSKSVNLGEASKKFGAFDGNYVGQPAGLHIQDLKLHTPADLRPKHVTRKKGFTNTEQVYDKLMEIILNAKKGIEYIPSCITLDGAESYADKHDLYFYNDEKKAVDINDDGVDGVVLVNRQGRPVVINGYKITKSDLPFKQEYYNTYDTPEKRAEVGGYGGFLRQKYGADEEFGPDGMRNVQFTTKNPPEDWGKLKQKGWTLPSAPRNSLTFNQRCTKIIQEILNQLLISHPGIGTVKTWLRGVIPRMKIVSLVYSLLVDSIVWNRLHEQETKVRILRTSGGDVDRFMEEFRAYKSDNRDKLKEFMTEQWNAVSEFIRDNAANTIRQIFADIGFDDTLINDAFTDAHFAESRIANPEVHSRAKLLKRTLKHNLNAAFDTIKPNYIKAAYGLA